MLSSTIDVTIVVSYGSDKFFNLIVVIASGDPSFVSAFLPMEFLGPPARQRLIVVPGVGSSSAIGSSSSVLV